MSVMIPDEKSFTSKHLKGAVELLLVIPIKVGFVNRSETVSFATRLRNLLGLFFEFRKKTADITLNDTPLPIDQLQTIYAAQWTVLEQENQLLVAVTFDRSWEEYFANLRGPTAALLDALFMHCVGYDTHTSRDGFASFTNWIRSHQRPCNFVFHNDPELTVTDLRSLRKLGRELGRRTVVEGAGAALTDFAEGHLIGSVVAEAQNGLPRIPDLSDALRSLYEFRRYFPDDERIRLLNGQRTAREIYDAAVGSLLAPIFELAAHRNVDLMAVCEELRPLQARPWVLQIRESLGNAGAQRQREATARPEWPSVDTAQVQANILQPIPTVAHGRVLLIQCHGPDAARRFLDSHRHNVTWESGRPHVDANHVYVNLGLTYACFARMQLPERVLKQFPKEFREGMEQRAGLLGDLGANHPHNWQRPLSLPEGDRAVSLSAVDAVMILQSSDAAALAGAVLEIARRGEGEGYEIVHEQPLRREIVHGHARDAFGLIEGSSQPQPQVRVGAHELNESGRAEGRSLVAPIDSVPLGELLLGHKNRLGEVELFANPRYQRPELVDLFRDSTFMVLRKLEQHAEQFDQYLRDAAAELEVGEDDVRRLIVGSGGQPGNSNDYDYVESSPAARCPLHAHVRLANPRLEGKDRPKSTPRILRRGFAYDQRDSEGGRGLVFMAYCASLTSQFETIQKWLNGANITGLTSWQNDILTGPKPTVDFPRRILHSGNGTRAPDQWLASIVGVAAAIVQNIASHTLRITGGDQLAVDAGPRRASARVLAIRQTRQILHATLLVAGHMQNFAARAPDVPRPGQAVGPGRSQPFVSLRWGLYLFVPSRRALDWLVASRPVEHDESNVAAGTQLIERLDALAQTNSDHARLEWKRFIEDPAFDEQARQIWAAIRAQGRPKDTPYGKLIATVPDAHRVLCDDGAQYSVEQYGVRLQATIGRHYLGIDARDADYQRLSAANSILHSVLTPQQAYADALAAGRSVIAAIQPIGGVRALQIEDDFARPVIRRLAEQWFGLPQQDAQRDPDDEYFQYFIDTSRYAFQPHPEPSLEARLTARRSAMNLDAYSIGGLVGRRLNREYATHTNQQQRHREIQLVLTGAVAGFCAPAIAGIKSVLDKWIESDEIGWLAERVRTSRDRERDLTRMLLEALARRPVPPLLYRTERESRKFAVVGLSSVYRDAQQHDAAIQEPWLFGGQNAWDQPPRHQGPHACPARTAAVQVLLGAVSAIFEQKNIRRDRRALIKFDP